MGGFCRYSSTGQPPKRLGASSADQDALSSPAFYLVSDRDILTPEENSCGSVAFAQRIPYRPHATYGRGGGASCFLTPLAGGAYNSSKHRAWHNRSRNDVNNKHSHGIGHCGYCGHAANEIFSQNMSGISSYWVPGKCSATQPSGRAAK